MVELNFHGDYAAVRSEVEKRLGEADGCHDMDHTLRVMKNAERLLRHAPEANAEVVRLAALLHDIARPEEQQSRGGRCHAQLGAEIAPKLLLAAGFPEEIASRVSDAVRSHRFRGKDTPASPEADLVYDADKLDSLGAVGLARAFLFAGHIGARVHNTEAEALAGDAYSREDTAYREYLVKLRYLPRRMRTAAGRRIAVARAAYMTDYFTRMEQEINGVSDMEN